MKDLVERFQCPGCVNGSDTKCGVYDYSQTSRRCISHVLGTILSPGGHIALGLPKGFNKPGYAGNTQIPMNIRLYDDPTDPDIEWNHLNLPVWALEQYGFLFVRTYAPRINKCWVDVIQGGTLAMTPSAIDVSKFIEFID